MSLVKFAELVRLESLPDLNHGDVDHILDISVLLIKLSCASITRRHLLLHLTSRESSALHRIISNWKKAVFQAKVIL